MEFLSYYVNFNSKKFKHIDYWLLQEVEILKLFWPK